MIKEEQSGGTVDWAQKLQTIKFVGLFWLQNRLLDTLKHTLFYVVKNFPTVPVTVHRTTIKDLAETIESSPLCITDLSKNKLVSYFLLIALFI
jgi:hypothetical protein